MLDLLSTGTVDIAISSPLVFIVFITVFITTIGKRLTQHLRNPLGWLDSYFEPA